MSDSNEDLCPPPVGNLSSASEKQMTHQAENLLHDSWHALMLEKRRVLFEVCCEPDSLLTEECNKIFGENSAVRFAHWNGADIETHAGRQYVIDRMTHERPLVVWVSPECGPYSPIQHLNRKTPQQRASLEEKRKHARKQYEGAMLLAKAAHHLGCTFVIELSERCEGWQQSWVEDLKEEVPLFFGICKGCQVGLKESSGQLLAKGWKLCSNHEESAKHMNLACSHDHVHGKCEGSRNCKKSGLYTKMFVRRFLLHLKRGNIGNDLVKELVDGTPSSMHSMSSPQSYDHVQELHAQEKCSLVLTKEEIKTIQRNLMKIHSATGHCNRDYLVQALKRRNAQPEVLELARRFSCPICQEYKKSAPRNHSTLSEIPPKWSTIQCDCGDWTHPETNETWQFLLVLDEGCRLRVGRCLGKGKKLAPSAQDFIDFFESQWQPLFGKPQTVRVDPAGAFRSRKMDEYLNERGINCESIPAEAHWQISLVERAIQTTKGMLTKLSSEFPSLRFEELFARTLWAQNSHDQYLGFSPLQHAVGRNPSPLGHLGMDERMEPPVLTESGISAQFGHDTQVMHEAEKVFLEEQNKQRLNRALQSGYRAATMFVPGDLVYYWRYQVTKSHGSSQFKRGKFLGPARVLATESRQEPDGSIRPGSCVWLFRGDRLLKAAPQQLRHASAREAAWSELLTKHEPIPWTIHGLLKSSPRKVYDDIEAEWTEAITNDPNLAQEIQSRSEHEQAARHDQQDAPEARPEGRDEPESSREAKRPIPLRDQHEWERPLKRASQKTPGVRKRKAEEDEELRESKAKSSSEPGHDDNLLAFVATSPSQHLTQEHACVSVEIDLPQGKDALKKSWLRDFSSFLANQVKKNHIEVFERFLTEEEKVKFNSAKNVEVKNFIIAKVFERLPPDKRPDRSQILKMRWVLTWKINPDTGERKAKARAVILGYLDPEYERRPSASPTMSRTSRQLFLQCAASYGFSVEKETSAEHFSKDDLSPERCSASHFQRFARN